MQQVVAAMIGHRLLHKDLTSQSYLEGAPLTGCLGSLPDAPDRFLSAEDDRGRNDRAGKAYRPD